MLRYRRLSAIISLFLFLMVAAGGGMDGYVLCVLPDGRASIESASGLCCDDAAVYHADSNGYPATVDASDEDGHHCDTCVDIPLSGPELIRAADAFSAKLRAVGFAPATFTAPVFTTAANIQPYHLPPPAARATLASIRTVNLRI